MALTDNDLNRAWSDFASANRNQTLDRLDLGLDENVSLHFDEYGASTFEVRDPLRFAREYNHLDGLTDSDGEISVASIEKIEAWLKSKFTAVHHVKNSLTASVEEPLDEDSEALVVSIAIPSFEEESVQYVFDIWLNPLSALVIDVTDPGTFGTEYLYTSVALEDN